MCVCVENGLNVYYQSLQLISWALFRGKKKKKLASWAIMHGTYEFNGTHISFINMD